MTNPTYPNLGLGNIINPHLGQSYEPMPGFVFNKLIAYFDVDPTDPKTVHPLRVPYTGSREIIRPDDRLMLSGSQVFYGTGIRIPKNIPFTGVASLILKTDLPATAFIVPFPHAPRDLYTPLLGQRVGAMNSLTMPAAPALKPFFGIDSVSNVIITEGPFQSNGILLAPSETDATMVVESNVPLQVTGKRDQILRVVVELYTCGQALPTQRQDLWGYNNLTMEV
jgi:hypothetical protein